MKHRKKSIYKYFSTILLILFFADYHLPVFAGTTGKIVGRIVDAETGEGLPGANILLTGTIMGASTDVDGDFIILNVPPGRYNLEASMLGYQTQTLQNIVVKVDLTTKAAFKLSSEAIAGQEVVVTAQAELITKDMTASQAVVSAQEIEALPVEEFEDVVTLQAGVVKGRDGELHIRGGRSEEVVYMVDGVALSDVYSGDIAVEIENNSLQELQVISGTFNAEYGRALSGIVNIVTKDVGDQLSAAATVYGGDYLSSGDDIFPHINDFSASGVQNYQFTLQGPIPFTNKKLKFLVTGRHLDDKGYIFGTRTFNPTDSSNVSFDSPSQYIIQATGDGAAVPMQPIKKTTLHGKLSYRFSPTLKLSTSLLFNDLETRNWSAEGTEFTPENQFHDFYRFLLNPDGASNQFKDGYTFLATWDHVLNQRTFYTLNFSNIVNEEKSFVYEDPFDSRYVHPDRFLGPVSAGNTFFTGGTDMWHSQRQTNTLGLKFDLTNQLTKTHQIKTGVEFRTHELDFEEFKLIPARVGGVEVSPFRPELPPPESPFNNRYIHQPREFAVYFQDKMEFEFMIVNVGLRYDYFDPNAPIPTDLGDPANPEKRTDASVKNQFSPRLGVAYPISDRGVLHFSFGQFFQMPLFQFLYANSEFEVEIGRLRTLMGNADLNPQKTTVYEVGLQQQLSDNLAFDLTVYYKDIRDLLGTEIYQLQRGADRYARYENRDFGNTRGFTFALTQRHSNWLSASVDYTFQIAEGNASEANAAFIDRLQNREPEKKLVPLDWDQRHTLNVAMTMSSSNKFSLTALGRYGAGLPYTPRFLNIRQAFENTARSPATLTVDLKTNYNFFLGGNRFQVFLKVFNLFDRRNEDIVYASTGRAGFNLEHRQSGQVKGINTLEEFFFNPPHHFSAPRQVRFGVTANF